MAKRHIKSFIIVISIAAVIVIALALAAGRNALIYGLPSLTAFAAGFLLWKALFPKSDPEEVTGLKEEITTLKRELDEKSRSKLNIVELSPILHVAVLNIDTSFVRTFIREEDGMSFNGALRVDIGAEYGVRLEEVGFNYDKETNTLRLSRFNPGLLSFSKKQLTWEIARSTRTIQLFGKDVSTVSDKAAEAFTKRKCEELRDGMEKEIDERSIAEFEWLKPLVSRQVTEMLKIMIGKPDVNIQICDGSDGEYLDFAGFRREIETQDQVARLTD